MQNTSPVSLRTKITAFPLSPPLHSPSHPANNPPPPPNPGCYRGEQAALDPEDGAGGYGEIDQPRCLQGLHRSLYEGHCPRGSLAEGCGAKQTWSSGFVYRKNDGYFFVGSPVFSYYFQHLAIDFSFSFLFVHETNFEKTIQKQNTAFLTEV